MFFFFPPLELNDGETKLDVCGLRQEGDVHNFDFLHITTTNDEGEELVTHFGIQGRSDHLAESLGKRARSNMAAKVNGKRGNDDVATEASPA